MQNKTIYKRAHRGYAEKIYSSMDRIHSKYSYIVASVFLYPSYICISQSINQSKYV